MNFLSTITSIKTKYIEGKATGHDFGRTMDYVSLTVETNDGLKGNALLPELFQFTGGKSFARGTQAIIDTLSDLVIGKDSLSLESIWEELFQKSTRWGRRGIVIQAISAIDVALWDLLGKECGKPIYKLLGGYRNKTPTYGNCAYQMPPKELAAKARKMVDDGFSAIKIRGSLTAVSPEEATERIKLVREAIGDKVKLMVDLNGTYNSALAAKMLNIWERYDLFWVEEPVPPDDFEGYRHIRKTTNVPLAAGEQLFTVKDFQYYIENDLVDIIQPDVYVVGGVTEWLNVWSLAKTYGVPVSPHLAPVESAHLVAAKPNTLWIEYVPPDNYLRSTMFEILSNPRSILYAEDGLVTPPESPGFGTEFNSPYSP